LNTDWLER